MDLGEDDNDEDNEEEEKKAEPKEQEETAQKHMQMVEKDQGRRKRDRIVKVEEKKTFKLQRKTLLVESVPEEQKTEVMEGTGYSYFTYTCIITEVCLYCSLNLCCDKVACKFLFWSDLISLF